MGTMESLEGKAPGPAPSPEQWAKDVAKTSPLARKVHAAGGGKKKKKKRKKNIHWLSTYWNYLQEILGRYFHLSWVVFHLNYLNISPLSNFQTPLCQLFSELKEITIFFGGTALWPMACGRSPGQGYNPCHSSDLSHSSNTTRSLTCYTTRELQI